MATKCLFLSSLSVIMHDWYWLVLVVRESLGWWCLNQMEVIMRQYKAVLVERSDRACPQQLLLFSSRWSEKLREFATEFMCEPSFIIASPMDISYYGQVRQVYCERTVDLSSFTADDVGHLSQWAAATATTLSQKTSRLWLVITLTHVDGFWYFFGQKCYW